MKTKSIFTRQLILYLGSLFVSFALLAFVLSFVYSEFYIAQKEEQLIMQGEKIAESIMEQYAKQYITGVYSRDEVTTQITFMEKYMGASVFLMNANGIIENATPKIEQSWIGQTLTDEAIKGVLDGKIVTIEGRISGMFQEPVLTVGYPINVNKTTLGGIFMCVSMPELRGSMKEMYAAGALSLIFVMCIGAIIVYVLSIRITKPLLVMNDAAKVMAGGNFEKRVEIDSNDEIGQLADSFNEMADSLEKHEKQRRDFVANISHDLRSPLTSIQGFISAMLDGTIGVEKHGKYLNIVLDETKRLAKLTNDIVELSSAQNSEITLSPINFNINKMIRDSLEKMEPRFKEKSIEVSVIFDGEDVIVNADKEKIQRVFHNLVDNAIKFSDAGGSVKVETTVKNNRRVLISVKDSGPGISKEDQKYVFDRFYKADASRGKDKTGGGLGLAIAKQFILAHEETIGVKSEKGKGAEFIFTLKLSQNNH